MITQHVRYVFVYGSLLSGSGNRRFDAWLRGATYPVSEGYIHARLYNLGTYPAAVVSSERHDKVYGTVLRLRRPDTLTRLDRYEVYRPDAHHHSDFIRRLTQITLLPTRQQFTAWVYLYNATVGGRPRIRHGNYLTFLATQRR